MVLFVKLPDDIDGKVDGHVFRIDTVTFKKKTVIGVDNRRDTRVLLMHVLQKNISIEEESTS